MKKIIFFTLSYLLLFVNVKALEIDDYTDVYDQTKTIQSIQKRYKFYNLKEEGMYVPSFFDSSNMFDFKDENNFYYGDFSDYSIYYSTNDFINYDHECKYVRLYKVVIDSRYLVLKKFSKSFHLDDLNINFYRNGEKKDLSRIKCTNCSNNIITSSSVIVYDLLEDVASDGRIYFEAYLPADIDYLFYLANDENLKDITFYKQISSNNPKITFDSTWVSNAVYTDYLFSTSPVQNAFYNLVFGYQTACRYRTKYIYNYNLIKEYVDNDYHVDVEGYEKDEDDFKYYYLYSKEESKNDSSSIKSANTFFNDFDKIEPIYINSSYENNVDYLTSNNDLINLDNISEAKEDLQNNKLNNKNSNNIRVNKLKKYNTLETDKNLKKPIFIVLGVMAFLTLFFLVKNCRRKKMTDFVE